MAYRSSARILSLLRGSCSHQQLSSNQWQPFLGSQAFGTSASEISSTASTASPAGTSDHPNPLQRCIPGSDVPQGHLRSDLTSSSCHIGLNRRRDLSLRHDINLWQDGTCRSLVDVFKGKKIVVVGFPGGRICAEKHIPGYEEAAASMCNKYIDGIALVTIATEGETPSPKLKTPSGGKVTLYCDRNAGFMKLLGLDLAPPDATNQGPRCQRFAAIVDDGILVKLRVEKSPAELAVSDAPSVMKLLDSLYADL